MTGDLPDNLATSHQLYADLLFTDLDLAFTFLDSAQISENAETKKRSVGHALRAYQEIRDKAEKVAMSKEKRIRLQTGLQQLAVRLADFGATV